MNSISSASNLTHISEIILISQLYPYSSLTKIKHKKSLVCVKIKKDSSDELF